MKKKSKSKSKSESKSKSKRKRKSKSKNRWSLELKTILLVRFLKTILYKFHSFQFTRIIKKFDDDDYFTAFEPHFSSILTKSTRVFKAPLNCNIFEIITNYESSLMYERLSYIWKINQMCFREHKFSSVKVILHKGN